MESKVTDLRFLIGLFLTLIGLIVLGAYLVGGGSSAESAEVNLLGGSLLTLVGIGMGAGSLLSK